MSISLRVIPGGAAADPAVNAAAPVDLAALVHGLERRQAWALDTMVDRFGPGVRRVLFRVLGAADPDHADLVQEVFARALENIGALTHATAFVSWVQQIAVFVAREQIRKRQRGRSLFSSGDLDTGARQPEAVAADEGVREATRCLYRVLDELPADERIVFTLRMIEGLELAELAEACGMSVPTVRRRLASAEQRFERLSKRFEALEPYRRTP